MTGPITSINCCSKKISRCYAYTRPVNFTDAVAECAMLGYDLVSVQNSKENDYVQGNACSFHSTVPIGP